MTIPNFSKSKCCLKTLLSIKYGLLSLAPVCVKKWIKLNGHRERYNMAAVKWLLTGAVTSSETKYLICLTVTLLCKQNAYRLHMREGDKSRWLSLKTRALLKLHLPITKLWNIFFISVPTVKSVDKRHNISALYHHLFGHSVWQANPPSTGCFVYIATE